MCRHVAALLSTSERVALTSEQGWAASSRSLLQISVNLKAVVAGVGDGHVSVGGEGEALGAVQGVC